MRVSWVGVLLNQAFAVSTMNQQDTHTHSMVGPASLATAFSVTDGVKEAVVHSQGVEGASRPIFSLGPADPEFARAAAAPSFDSRAAFDTTYAELPGLIAQLAASATTATTATTTTTADGEPATQSDGEMHGEMHKIFLDLEHSGRVGFLLWLPAGFGNSSRPAWPVCFFLHGAGEGQMSPDDEQLCASDPHCLPPTNGTTLTMVARHGLAHRLAENKPFSSNFVVVAPQRPYIRSSENYTGSSITNWEDHLVMLEELRTTIFASSTLFDRKMASVTGISAGAIGALAWATYGNASDPQPWAAVMSMSGMWPYTENSHDVRNPPTISQAAFDRLTKIPGIYLAACANDETIPIALGRKGGPPCIVLRLDDNYQTMCGYASDAIFERLQEAGHSHQVVYKRIETCTSPFMPTDTGPALASWYNPLQAGHDSWNKIYAESEFSDWLLNQRSPE